MNKGVLSDKTSEKKPGIKKGRKRIIEEQTMRKIHSMIMVENFLMDIGKIRTQLMAPANGISIETTKSIATTITDRQEQNTKRCAWTQTFPTAPVQPTPAKLTS
jgi:hypothetical protein